MTSQPGVPHRAEPTGDDAWPSLPGRIRMIVTEDADLFRSLPGGRVLALVACLLAVGLGVIVGYVRPTAPDLYTESVPFLVAAVLIASIARTPAALLLLAYAVADAAWVAGQWAARPFDWTPDVLLGRAGATLFLGLLVLTIPWAGRAVGAVMTVGRRGTRVGVPMLPALGAAVATAVLAFAWANYAPQVANGALPRPTSAVLYLVQDGATVLAIASAIATALAWLLLRARGGLAGDAIPLLLPVAEWSVVGILRRVLAWAAILLIFWSLVTAPVDLVVLLAGMLAGEVLALIVRNQAGVARAIAAVPYAGRLAIAAAVPFIVIVLSIQLYWKPSDPEPPTPFFPYVVAFSTAFLLIRPLLFATLPVRAPTRPATTGLVPTALVVGLVALGWLAIPAVALADDCTGFKHCAAALIAGAASAALLPLIAALAGLNSWANSAGDDAPDLPPVPDLPPLPPAEGEDMPEGRENRWHDGPREHRSPGGDAPPPRWNPSGGSRRR